MPAQIDVPAWYSASREARGAHLRFLGCSAAEADDLCQETFAAVLRAPFEDREPRSTAAYPRRLGRNALLELRRQAAQGPVLGQLERAENRLLEIGLEELLGGVRAPDLESRVGTALAGRPQTFSMPMHPKTSGGMD